CAGRGTGTGTVRGHLAGGLLRPVGRGRLPVWWPWSPAWPCGQSPRETGRAACRRRYRAGRRSAEQALERAAQPIAVIVFAGELVEVALDLLGIGLVIATDVVEQPAREHRAQFVGDVLTGLETHVVLGDALDEHLVHALVGGAEG